MSASFFELATTLREQLSALEALADNGDWEQLETVAPEFAATMVAVRATPLPPKLNVADLKMLQDIEIHLRKAAALCAERQEQIQPLITAFNTNSKLNKLP